MSLKVGTYDGQTAYRLNFAGRFDTVTAQIGVSGGSGSKFAGSASISFGWHEGEQACQTGPAERCPTE